MSVLYCAGNPISSNSYAISENGGIQAIIDSFTKEDGGAGYIVEMYFNAPDTNKGGTPITSFYER